jgi:L-ascorbate metabolism protein UlaG (beta-lactamase superfamily)
MKKTLCFCFIVSLFCFAGVANADVGSAKALMKDIHWLGHDTFRISGEKVIYTDPFKLKGKDVAEKADIVFITHEHYDHCSPEDVKKIQKPETIIITTPSCAAKLTGDIKTAKPGDVFEIGGIHVEAVPAYNIGKKHHPVERKDVGYIFTVKGQRIYLAGDTDRIPEMKTFKDINIAFLPVSGTYVMTEREAVKAALDIKPDIAVPMHYGTVIGTRMNAEKFARGLKRKIEVVIMKEE